MADERFTEAVRNKSALTQLLNIEGWEIFDAVLRDKEAILLADFTDEKSEVSDARLREMRIGIKLVRSIRLTPAVMLAEAEGIIKEFAEIETQDENVDTAPEDEEKF